MSEIKDKIVFLWKSDSIIKSNLRGHLSHIFVYTRIDPIHLFHGQKKANKKREKTTYMMQT